MLALKFLVSSIQYEILSPSLRLSRNMLSSQLCLDVGLVALFEVLDSKEE